MSKENTITKIEYKKFRQLYCNGKFDLLAIASEYMKLDGFTVKPGMMIYQARNKGHKDVFFVAFGPDFNCRGFVYGWLIFGPDHFLNTNMLRSYQFKNFEEDFTPLTNSWKRFMLLLDDDEGVAINIFGECCVLGRGFLDQYFPSE